MLVFVTPVSVVQVVRVSGIDVEHNDPNLVVQSYDDVDKVTEMTVINAFPSSLVYLHLNHSWSTS